MRRDTAPHLRAAIARFASRARRTPLRGAAHGPMLRSGVREDLVEGRRAALDAVDLVSLGQEELCEVAPVLPGDSCHEGDLARHGRV
jgi:hypothetical protein